MSFFGKIRFKFKSDDKFRYFPIGYEKIYLDSEFECLDYSKIMYIDLKTGDIYTKKTNIDIDDKIFIALLTSYYIFVESNLQIFDMFAIGLINSLVVDKLSKVNTEIKRLALQSRIEEDR